MKTATHLLTVAILASLSLTFVAAADDSPTSPVLLTANNDGDRVLDRDRDRNMDDDTIKYPLYQPQELNLDLFGSASLGQQTLEHLSGNRVRHHGLYGGGGGLTFFFLRYVGVGGEYEADARAHRFVDSASGNIYLRFPIEHIGLSPYVFGGGGYQFEDIRQSFAQGGGGLEYRFCRHLGVFVDGRYVFARKTEDYALARAGFRISF